MCYLLQSDFTHSYTIYCSSTKLLYYGGTRILDTLKSPPHTCNSMRRRKSRMIWGSGTTWYNIIATWQGLPADILTAHPELLV
jgi:hypothetical protein